MADTELEKVVMSFRVIDLKELLKFAKLTLVGKKKELQQRALNLIRSHSPPVLKKVRELQEARNNPPRAQKSQEAEQLVSMNLPPKTSSHQVNIPDTKSTDLPFSKILELLKPSILTGYDYLGFGSVFQGLGFNYCDSALQEARYNLLKVQKSQEADQLVSINPSAESSSHKVNIPDVKSTDLPDSEILGELLKPTILSGCEYVGFESSFQGLGYKCCNLAFNFSPLQISNLLIDNRVKVLLRFGLMNSDFDQKDNFFGTFVMRVNTEIANPLKIFRINELKYPGFPFDITQQCRLTITVPNEICIIWKSIYGFSYIVSVYLVRKQDPADLINHLRVNKVQNPDFTTVMIKKKLMQDCESEITTISLRVSLICPLGRNRMTLPCRAKNCKHLECFDASLYMQMNEKKPIWLCPVCNKSALFKDLAIDGLFLDIISKVTNDCTEVEFHKDGSWTPLRSSIDISQKDIDTSSVVGFSHVEKRSKATVKKLSPVNFLNLSCDIVSNSDSDNEDSEQDMSESFQILFSRVKTIPFNNPISVPVTSTAISQVRTIPFNNPIYVPVASSTPISRVRTIPFNNPLSMPVISTPMTENVMNSIIILDS